MIAKPEWTQSNAQQNREQLQNPTMGATHFSLFLVTSVKQWLCATLIVYKYRQIFPTEEFSCRICRYY